MALLEIIDLNVHLPTPDGPVKGVDAVGAVDLRADLR
jgi:ABC-type antimicrobial peptide transport system ATPase subunit